MSGIKRKMQWARDATKIIYEELHSFCPTVDIYSAEYSKRKLKLLSKPFADIQDKIEKLYTEKNASIDFLNKMKQLSFERLVYSASKDGIRFHIMQYHDVARDIRILESKYRETIKLNNNIKHSPWEKYQNKIKSDYLNYIINYIEYIHILKPEAEYYYNKFYNSINKKRKSIVIEDNSKAKRICININT